VSLGAHLSNVRDGTAGGQAHAHINGAKLGEKSFQQNSNSTKIKTYLFGCVILITNFERLFVD